MERIASRSALLAILTSFAWTVSASAAVFQVTTTADTSDGACDSDCSLREAVIASNELAGADTILVPAGHFTLTLAGANEEAAATGDLDILEDVTIIGAGAGATIVGQSFGDVADRLFDIQPGGHAVVIRALRLHGGDATLAAPPWGGAILSRAESAAQPGGNLTLEDVELTSSRADMGGAVSAVGPSTGSTIVRRSRFIGNQAIPGVAGSCGALCSNGDTTIEDSTFEGNAAQIGSAISVVRFDVGAHTPVLTMTRSTVAKNTSDPSIPVGAVSVESAIATLENDTLSGNSGAGLSALSGSSVSVRQLTIVESPVPAITVFGSNSVTVKNTLLRGGCTSTSPGAIVSGGGNLESPGNTCGLAGTGDQVNVADPKLGTLGNFGGLTQTIPLIQGSAAIGHALAGACPATDQRGIARPFPVGGNCDVGSYETTGCGASLSVAGAAPLAIALRRRRSAAKR